MGFLNPNGIGVTNDGLQAYHADLVASGATQDDIETRLEQYITTGTRNETIYETEDERTTRYSDEADIIEAYVRNSMAEGDTDYESALSQWQARDLAAQRIRSEVDSGWRLQTSGRTNEHGSMVIGQEDLLGRTAEQATASGYTLASETSTAELWAEKVGLAWTNFQANGEGGGAAVEGDYQFFTGIHNQGRTTAMQRSDGSYVRYNENGEVDPNGQYYLHIRHDSRQDGAVQVIDDALGTDLSSLIDEDILEVVGGLLDMPTGGLASQAIGGDEYTANVNAQMNAAFNNQWAEISQVGTAITDTALNLVTGGLWTYAMAGRTALQGVNAEAHGVNYDWEQAGINLAAQIVVRAYGPDVNSFTSGLLTAEDATAGIGANIVGGAAQGLASGAFMQLATSGELDAMGLGVNAIAGGIGGTISNDAASALTETAINASYAAYQAGEISQAQHEEEVAALQQQQRLAQAALVQSMAANVTGAFGGSYTPSSGSGINTANTTNAF